GITGGVQSLIAMTARHRAAKGTPKPNARARVERARTARRQPGRQHWWQTPRFVRIALGFAAFIGVAAVAAIVVTRPREAPLPSGASWTTVVNAVTHVPPAMFDTIGTGDQPNPLKSMTSSQPLGGADGKPELLYIGAEFCSTCASERWSLIAALSRFGEFTDLQPTKSASGESYSELPSFTFYRGGYNSPYLNFVGMEIANRSKQPLQRLSEDQQALFTLYDRANTIPFLDFGNQYYAVGSGYDMNLLNQKTWDDVAGALADPTSPITKGIVGNANYITAGI